MKLLVYCYTELELLSLKNTFSRVAVTYQGLKLSNTCINLGFLTIEIRYISFALHCITDCCPPQVYFWAKLNACLVVCIAASLTFAFLEFFVMNLAINQRMLLWLKTLLTFYKWQQQVLNIIPNWLFVLLWCSSLSLDAKEIPNHWLSLKFYS